MKLVQLQEDKINEKLDDKKNKLEVFSHKAGVNYQQMRKLQQR